MSFIISKKSYKNWSQAIKQLDQKKKIDDFFYQTRFYKKGQMEYKSLINYFI
jgi:hypothetical protein